MINLEKEKNLKLSSQQIYDIIAKAVELADDDGFLNNFVFERSLYIVSLAVLNEEKRNNISIDLEIKSPMDIWDELLKDGSIEELIKDYKQELDYISDQAEIWYEDYATFCASPRGMIGSLEGLTGSFMENMSDQVASLQDNAKINEAIATAEKWGMNNAIDDSLFLADNKTTAKIITSPFTGA